MLTHNRNSIHVQLRLIACGVQPAGTQSRIEGVQKRLKLTCLDDQSRIGVGPMSSGRASAIVAITPPDQYPTAVWEELARQGKLRRAGDGQYEMPAS